MTWALPEPVGEVRGDHEQRQASERPDDPPERRRPVDRESATSGQERRREARPRGRPPAPGSGIRPIEFTAIDRGETRSTSPPAAAELDDGQDQGHQPQRRERALEDRQGPARAARASQARTIARVRPRSTTSAGPTRPRRRTPARSPGAARRGRGQEPVEAVQQFDRKVSTEARLRPPGFESGSDVPEIDSTIRDRPGFGVAIKSSRIRRPVRDIGDGPRPRGRIQVPGVGPIAREVDRGLGASGWGRSSTSSAGLRSGR